MAKARYFSKTVGLRLGAWHGMMIELVVCTGTAGTQVSMIDRCLRVIQVHRYNRETEQVYEWLCTEPWYALPIS